MNAPSRPLSKLFPPTPTQCISLLQSFTRSQSVALGKQLHGVLLSAGLLHGTNLPSKLAAMYSLCGHPSDAHHLFDRIPTRIPFLWNALIRGHVQSGLHRDALLLFSQMVSSGHRPDNFTYPFALKACGVLSLLRTGTQIHSKALSSGFGLDEFVQNSLIAMYISYGRMEAAMMVFDLMGNRTVVSWNTMMVGFVQNGCSAEALMLFDKMVDAGVEVDQATVVSVLPACAQLKELQRGRRVHELVKEKGLGVHMRVRNSLVDMYAKCGVLGDAREVFDDRMCERDVISWTAMIGGYALNGYPQESLVLSHQMISSGIRPNSVTMASLLSACANLSSICHGKCIHGSCIRLCLCSDIIVETALIDMYATCGSVDLSSRVFMRGSRRTATWNAVISSYTRNRKAKDAIEHFKLMLAEGILPDLATIASILPSYGVSGDLQQANNIHCYLIRMGFLRNMEATTGLIDIYAKVGCLGIARELFDGLPVKDLVSWSAIIAGYGKHGDAEAAIELFDRMVSEVEPNEVTFTTMLYTCSHAGMVDKGLSIFNRMRNSTHLKPNVDHYACIVDLLGRAGRLEEAHGLIRRMPFEANHAVWGALLGACAIHENVELGEIAAMHLFEIEPDNTGNYVLLGNIYAAVGRWEDAESVRRMLVERRLMKAPGRSLIEARQLGNCTF